MGSASSSKVYELHTKKIIYYINVNPILHFESRYMIDDSVKYEINCWLVKKWPHVFGKEDGLSDMKDQFMKFQEKLEKIGKVMEKKETNAPIQVPLDLVEHMIQRIDHYLYKKWPDIFVDEGLKSFKKDIEIW